LRVINKKKKGAAPGEDGGQSDVDEHEPRLPRLDSSIMGVFFSLFITLQPRVE